MVGVVSSWGKFEAKEHKPLFTLHTMGGPNLDPTGPYLGQNFLQGSLPLIFATL